MNKAKKIRWIPSRISAIRGAKFLDAMATLQAIQADITTLQVDAIVNAANSSSARGRGR